VAPLGFHEHFHIAVGVLADNARPRAKLALGLGLNAATILFFAIVLVSGIGATMVDAQIPLYSLPLARSWMTWVLPASAAAVIWICLDNALALIVSHTRAGTA
jgi:TRAP-type C4-dicarboxylate transport system permease small subunit